MKKHHSTRKKKVLRPRICLLGDEGLLGKLAMDPCPSQGIRIPLDIDRLIEAECTPQFMHCPDYPYVSATLTGVR